MLSYELIVLSTMEHYSKKVTLCTFSQCCRIRDAKHFFSVVICALNCNVYGSVNRRFSKDIKFISIQILCRTYYKKSFACVWSRSVTTTGTTMPCMTWALGTVRSETSTSSPASALLVVRTGQSMTSCQTQTLSTLQPGQNTH